ncbi:DUF3892 domain-containing protein [Bradyrhizobium sp. CB82]|nr:DUF3892 domain-containing protein [Bradyrhizobium sp. CB82]WFU44968.1 DUF3892 domain-containing protein [Bradyrhizobium sp. CB82]
MSRHEHISDVGGPKPEGGRWREKVEDVVRFIENKQHRFYTQDGNSTAWVAVRKSPSGRKFIQTHADGVWNDNLLALDECST